jgi:hypothetical protein
MSRETTIFVSIACLADPDVIDTVANLFATARHPERVHVGICLQIDPGDPAFNPLNDFSNVRLDVINYEASLGPIFARARCERLLGDEDFYLQIDCHSRFFPDWDEILLQEYGKAIAINSRAVISHYPINIRNMENPEYLGSIGHVNRYRQVDTDALKSHGSLIRMPAAPLPSIGISAAMLFMEGRAKKKIAYDPYLHFGLHAAEQVLYGLRLWTHGFEIFCPTRHSLATEYEGARDRIPEQVKQVCATKRGDWPRKTWSKVKYLLQLDSIGQVDGVYYDDVADENFPYGMGSARSLLDYYRLTGLHEQLKALFPNYAYRDS